MPHNHNASLSIPITRYVQSSAPASIIYCSWECDGVRRDLHRDLQGETASRPNDRARSSSLDI